MITVKELTKRYGAHTAVDALSFTVDKGQIYGLLGPNGAGKSTLIKSIAGAHQCDSGTITIDGKEFHSLTPLQAKEMGVEVVYQEFNQMPSLSVAENIYLTELRGKRIVADQREFERKAAELFKEMNLDLNPKVKVASLTNGYKQMVEIAKAISKPTTKILILDEPTRGIDVGATEFIRKKLVELSRSGIAVLLVSADLNEVMELSDSLIVMQGGHIAAYFEDTKELTDDQMGEYMLGLKQQPAEQIRRVCHD